MSPHLRRWRRKAKGGKGKRREGEGREGRGRGGRDSNAHYATKQSDFFCRLAVHNLYINLKIRTI